MPVDRGTVIKAGAVVEPGAQIGANVIIGGAGAGWAVGNTTLGFERGSLSGATVNLPYARTGSVNDELARRAGDVSG